MDGAGVGTAAMLGIAAALWFLYLVPTWLRRREYLATERTTARIQYTMAARALRGEDAGETDLTATAREAARQERILRTEQRRADAMAIREAATVRRAADRPFDQLAVDPGILRRRRMRRTRRAASVLMLAATGVTLVQFWLIATTGMSLGAWFVLIGALAAGGVAIAVQRRLDVLAMPRARVASRRRRGVTMARYEVAEPRVPWTPVEMPKPLYLSQPSIAAAAPAAAAPATRADLDQALTAAIAASEQNLRDAQSAPEVAPLRTASRFASMGRLDPTLTRETDLDEVLKRRRSAG